MPLRGRPRQKAQTRLDRHTVGESVAEERALPSRLNGRSEHRAVGEDFDPSGDENIVWDHRPVPLKQYQMPRPEPCAPLLKRIIRYPMEMEPLSPVRIQVFDATRPEPASTKRESVQMVFRAPRDARDVRSPMATIDHDLAFRPHPFGRRRIALEEEGR